MERLVVRTQVLCMCQLCFKVFNAVADIRLDGGAAEDDSISSSASLPRLRPLGAGAPRFAADMFGRSGELLRD